MQLSARSGPQAGQRFSAAKPETTIGRSSDNDIVLKDPLVSRHHARIRREGEGYVLEDLGSANGTILNGTPLAALQRLQPGDEIRIGGTGLVVEMAEQRPAAVRRAPAASGWLVAAIGAVGLLFVALLVVIAILLVQPRDEDGQTLRSAPALLQPANGASFRGTFTPVVLRWAEADGGTANGPYRVVIQYTTSGEPRSLEQWVDAPSFEVPTELRERNSGDRFQWQVTAMRQTGSNADGSPAGEPVSQASETRFFTWTSGGVILATTTATAALQPAQTPTPTPRLTPVPTPPLAAPATPTATDVPLPTMVPTRADTPTARPDTPTPTEAPTLLPPPTPTSRPSPTPTRLVGQTPAPTATPTQVLIAPRTPTPTPTFISPPTPTPTRSFTPVPPTPTPTFVPPPTPTPTRRPSATPSPVPSPTPTFFVPPTPTPTRPPATPTPTPTIEIFTSPTPPQTPWPTPQPPSGF